MSWRWTYSFDEESESDSQSSFSSDADTEIEYYEGSDSDIEETTVNFGNLGLGPKSDGRCLTPAQFKKLSLLKPTNPKWLDIDFKANTEAIFRLYNDKYFAGKLRSVKVQWSNRLKATYGNFVYGGRRGEMIINISEPLYRYGSKIEPFITLLHEMIHAYLYIIHRDDNHGPNFLAECKRIGRLTGLEIDVYGDSASTTLILPHVWRCDGPCRRWEDYNFGYVRRAINRAPSRNEPWFRDHRKECGGNFVKIREPSCKKKN